MAQGAVELDCYHVEVKAAPGHRIKIRHDRQHVKGGCQTVADRIGKHDVQYAGRRTRSRHQVATEGRVQRHHNGLQQGIFKLFGIHQLLHQVQGDAPLFLGSVMMVLQARLLRLALNIEGMHAGDGVELGAQDRRMHGLDHVIVGAGFECAHDDVAIVFGGNKQNWRPVLAAQLTDAPRRRPAIHQRHLAVHQHQIRPLRCKGVHRLLTVLHQQNLMSELAHQRRDQCLRRRIILGDQNLHVAIQKGRRRRVAPAATTPARGRGALKPLGNTKNFSEIGDFKHLAHRPRAILQGHRLFRRIRAFLQQQQHAKSRAVDVINATQIEIELAHLRRREQRAAGIT